MNTTQPDLPLWKIWWLAARPKTLPAAMAPVVVGMALAWHEHAFHAGAALAALLGALLLQIGANFSNDALDYQRGADTHERLGPLRVTQAGLLSPQQVMRGTWVVFGLAALCGLYLIARAGWPILVIGLASILAALAYTGGPYPLGYHGWGEAFVFLFFGPVAVVGTYYVQALDYHPLAGIAALPVGLLATAILVVNNYRDLETDRAAGKHTLAVRLGPRGAQIEYLLLLLGAYLTPLYLWWSGRTNAGVLLTWLTLPLSLPLFRAMFRERGRILNRTLAGTARLELLFSLAFALGLFL